MQTRIIMLLFSGAIGLTLSGCAMSSPTMRAQSPEHFGSMDSGPAYGGGEMMVNHFGEACPPSGMCGPGQGCPPGAACPPQRGCHSCAGHGCRNCINLPFHPVHRNFHTYDVPAGLSYPQQDTPAATYQYPYYTFRGPTDFFMK